MKYVPAVWCFVLIISSISITESSGCQDAVPGCQSNWCGNDYWASQCKKTCGCKDDSAGSNPTKADENPVNDGKSGETKPTNEGSCEDAIAGCQVNWCTQSHWAAQCKKTCGCSGSTESKPKDKDDKGAPKDDESSNGKGNDDKGSPNAPEPSTGTGQLLTTKCEFNEAIRARGWPTPKAGIYEELMKQSKSFNSKEEFAMFLAQLMHESGGFQYTEEIYCSTVPYRCAHVYRDRYSLPGVYYHGRGFIQLSWAANYRKASMDLGYGDKLLKHPELVRDNLHINVQTAVHYWMTRVRTMAGVKEGYFGKSTRAINGAVECNGQHVAQSKNRWKNYLLVAKAMHLKNLAKESGCYN